MRRFVLAVSLLSLLGCSPKHGQSNQGNRVIYVVDSVIVQNGDSTVAVFAAGQGGPMYQIQESGQEASRTDLMRVVLGGIVLLGVLSFLFFRSLNRKKKEIGGLAEEVDAANRRSEDISRAVSLLLEEKVSMVRAITEKHNALQTRKDEAYINQLEQLRDRVENYDGYLREMRRGNQFLGELEQALNAADQDIMIRLRTVFGSSLKEEDYRFYACVFAGLGNASISFISGLAPGTVRTRKSRYKDKLEALPASEDKELFLRVFENGRA